MWQRRVHCLEFCFPANQQARRWQLAALRHGRLADVHVPVDLSALDGRAVDHAADLVRGFPGHA
jgi:Ser/Thr protein kinase RdoA (MazF antagonist)